MKAANEPTNEIAGKPSRLPAGSTLEVSTGVHVPHPHAEVNLPGMGDPRLGETDAVTEFVNEDGALEKKPLADEVKPQVLTVAKDANFVEKSTKAGDGSAASSAELKNAVDDNKANVTEHHEQ